MACVYHGDTAVLEPQFPQIGFRLFADDELMSFAEIASGLGCEMWTAVCTLALAFAPMQHPAFGTRLAPSRLPVVRAAGWNDPYKDAGRDSDKSVRRESTTDFDKQMDAQSASMNQALTAFSAVCALLLGVALFTQLIK